MIQQERFISKLRSLGYQYKGQTDRVLSFKKSGGTHYVMVRRRDQLDEAYVRSTLRQCGCQDAEIETFIGECKS